MEGKEADEQRMRLKMSVRTEVRKAFYCFREFQLCFNGFQVPL